MRHPLSSILGLAVLFGAASLTSAAPSVDNTVSRMAEEQATLKFKIEQYDRALTVIQKHLEKTPNTAGPVSEPVVVSQPPSYSTPRRLSDVTYTLSPETSPPASPKAKDPPAQEDPNNQVISPVLAPDPSENQVSELSEEPWWDHGLVLGTGLGLGVVLLSCVYFWRCRRQRHQAPLFQAADSRYLPLPSETHPLYRFFVGQACDFLKKGLEIRAIHKTKPLAVTIVSQLSPRPYGRWILGIASFEDEVEVADMAVKQMMKTFPLDKRTAVNTCLLRDATLAVLRGQSHY